MSAPLSDEERRRYTATIDAILATADLETISRKKIRQGLETAEGRDLAEQKDAIKKLIEARFDAISSAQADNASDPDPEPEQLPKKRSVENGASDSVASQTSASPEPARKKAKRSSSAEDADARLAAQLQAQENKLARGRATRGGDKKPVKKKAPRKKSAKKVKADGESDSGSDAEAPKRKAGGGLQKPFALSPALQELCGEAQLSRTQVVKGLWTHIKAHNLQDPNDRRQIICDDKLQAIFKQSKVSMFGMNRYIGHHLYPIEEAAPAQ